MENRLTSGGAIMQSGQKQASVKRVPLSDLSNATRNAIANSQGSSLPKGPISDFLKISGTKRHPSDGPPSPHRPSTFKNGTNVHLVYVRRKLEEPGKVSTRDGMEMATSTKSGKFNNSERKELSCRQEQTQQSRVSCSPAFSTPEAASVTASSQATSVPALRMPTTGCLPIQTNCTVISSGFPSQDNSPSSCNVHWKERFLRLQMFLTSCNQSNQEEYIEMLRSLSAVGRSKHAVELEKRAIRLLLEEGKELRRMKLLNVLGKASPNHV
uniref:ABC transporter-like protein ECU11_1340 n=1 Tax=Anthurium amnicola TaxID=1678845 RepID=A0A1D1YW29_9ARAE